MAHTACPNGHDMWNGDGKPVVWAFRVGFFHDFMKQHPNCVLGDNGEYWQIYDCVDDALGEDLDCWYCDECKGLVVYVDLSRYDFQRMDMVPEVFITDFDEWEEYIALRDRPFEDFQEYYEGKNPLEAVETYDFEYHYKVSPDKKTIYAFGRDGKAVFGYSRSNYTEYSPDLEIRLSSGDDTAPYMPYACYKGKMELKAKVGKYAHLKDGRTVHIDEVVIPGHSYRGRDTGKKDLPVVEFCHSEISSVADEICKDVEVK